MKIELSTLLAAEAYLSRLESAIRRLQELYGFSESEAMAFIQSLPSESVT